MVAASSLASAQWRRPLLLNGGLSALCSAHTARHLLLRSGFGLKLPRLQSAKLSNADRWLHLRWSYAQPEECGKARAFPDGGNSNWQIGLAESLAGSSSCLSVHVHDIGMTVLVATGAYVWVKLFDFLSRRNVLKQKLSRKLVHISSGLLYVLCWPFFSKSGSARYLAALVPLANGVRLLIFGLGVRKSEGLVKSMTRDGDPKELLRGPFYYVIVLFLVTIIFWRDSPVGIIALSMMCGGDGIADIVGRTFGSHKLPYNKAKSWAGSIAMLIFGYLVSFGMLQYFTALGFYKYDLVESVIGVFWISVAATIVESLPVTSEVDDNIMIPITTILLGLAMFP
ncbi:hypothetical protein O6H91_16G035200 [Diphasiastrum complanatum]|uniref:Uncharacterized protein n=2 Tax=Diphasiastrum complanatum TaxID=34168 RepID=A0ACC2BBD4_DIPCM|nr:hypothetical protein O6H91_16G034900 [Diphasiastrum complanatum]KAJ7527073.1 hypothetical protein O6H91_16G035200 [Diphasiastrum complanatum]